MNQVLKSLQLSAIFLFQALAPFHTLAEDTNLFVTVGARDPSESAFQIPRNIAVAKRANESRPAAQDTDGNWGAATNGLQLSMRFQNEPPLLSRADIIDVEALITKLADPADDDVISKYLRSKVSALILERIQIPAAVVDPDYQESLIQDLNRILRAESLFTVAAFDKVFHSPEIHQLTNGVQNLPENDRIRLNRMLLEEAYPRQITLSYNISKTTFKVGEPIVARVIIRNTTMQRVVYVTFRGEGMDSELCRFIVVNDKAEPVPRIRETPAIGSVSPSDLIPGTQRKYYVQLDMVFDLGKPGKYTVHASKILRANPDSKDGLLQSGVVTITILP